MSKNLVLCGFMGCGKSAVGERLAARLGREWIDMDTRIEEETGTTISDIFKTQGEAAFRDLEHDLAIRLGHSQDKVISTGGGALTFARNAKAFASSLILFLNPGFESCYRRIKDSDRPLVKANSPLQLQKLYEQRALLYRACCQLEIVTDGTIDEVTDEICRRLSMYPSKP